MLQGSDADIRRRADPLGGLDLLELMLKEFHQARLTPRTVIVVDNLVVLHEALPLAAVMVRGEGGVTHVADEVAVSYHLASL